MKDGLVGLFPSLFPCWWMAYLGGVWYCTTGAFWLGTDSSAKLELEFAGLLK